MAIEIMAPPRFAVDDLVRLVDQRGGRTIWRVVDLDTNKTPVRDSEHAYKLFNGRYHRFAYESELYASQP